MLWKLFIKIITFYVITANISLGYSNHKNYECILGSKTPYRCVANYDDSELEYSGILKYFVIFYAHIFYP